MGIADLLRGSEKQLPPTLPEKKRIRGRHGLDVCRECYGRFYWRPRGASWRCAFCDPPLHETIAAAADKTHIEFDSLAGWYAARAEQMLTERLAVSYAEAYVICEMMDPFAGMRNERSNLDS